MSQVQNETEHSVDEVVSVDFYQQEKTVKAHLDVSDLLEEDGQKRQATGQASYEAVEGVKMRHLWLWALVLLFLCVASFTLYDLFQTLSTAYESAPIWASIMTVSSVGLVLIVLYALMLEVRGLWNLRTFETPLTLASLQQLNDKEAVLQALKTRARSQQASSLASELNERYFQTLQPDYSAQELVEIYLLNVEKPLYQQAEVIIQKEAQNVGVATAMVPYDSVQILLLIRWNLLVVRKVCELYELKLGVLARARLIRMLWLHIIMDVAIDQAINQVLQSVSQNLMGKVIDQTSEATTSALLVYRMGKGLLKHLSLMPSK